jgi:uncharacterized protein involved in exopolysaccharide biosynthesis
LAFVSMMLDQYPRAALRRWRVGVGVSLLICLTGVVAIHALPDQFESTARLYVNLDAILMTSLDRLESGDAPLTRAKILRYALLYKPNVKKLLNGNCPGLVLCVPPDHERDIARISAGITVTQQTRSLFLIAYRGADPMEARDVLRALLKIFVQTTDGTDFQRQDPQNARRSLERQVRYFEQRLRAAEKRRADFRLRHRDIFGDHLNPGEVDSLPRVVAVLDDMLRDALARQDTARRELDKTLPMLTPDADASQPSRPSSDYSRMRDRSLEADTDVASLTRRRDEARARLERLQNVFQEQPALLTEYQNIERDYTTLRDSYETVLRRFQAGGIWLVPDMPLPNARVEEVKTQIIDPPEVPRMPIAPNRPIMIMCLVLVAPIVGFAISGLSGMRRGQPGNRSGWRPVSRMLAQLRRDAG